MGKVIVKERDKITDRLEGMLADIRYLEHDDQAITVDTLDSCVAQCAEILTRIKRLRGLVQNDTGGGKMYTRGMREVANSSVTERVVIVMQLEEMVEAVECLDLMPIREALDSLDGVIEDCEETLTNLKALRKWANQATEGVNIPF